MILLIICHYLSFCSEESQGRGGARVEKMRPIKDIFAEI